MPRRTASPTLIAEPDSTPTGSLPRRSQPFHPSHHQVGEDEEADRPDHCVEITHATSLAVRVSTQPQQAFGRRQLSVNAAGAGRAPAPLTYRTAYTYV